ncbi:phosphatase PAP2 family protein [Cryptosporangium phraense]|uniref:phosphatase PAP2 family protein n=1 Tax=Cryptosporangium phraense TaxID=2593070 RepID=UPI0014780797|nr:phosphatase PAP2 family protein [Cryptosporangium phraense]
MATTTIPSAVAAPPRQWVRVIATELALIALGIGAYLAVGLGSADRTEAAYAHAKTIRSLEYFGLERLLSTWWAEDPLRTAIANAYYVTGHFAVPFVVFGLLVLFDPAAYYRFRSAFVAASLIGVAISWAWPSAPPRLLEGLTNAPVISGAENPYAAFPSMHVGWAVWCALAVSALTARWWARALGWLHAAVTGVVVLVTGHHWVLDVVGGVLVAFAGLAIARLWEVRARFAVS